MYTLRQLTAVAATLLVVGHPTAVPADEVDPDELLEFPEETVEVKFRDAQLERIVRSILNKPKGTLTNQDVALLTSLKVKALGIVHLEGMEYAINLRELLLHGNNAISDLRPLGSLKRLRRLNLSKNRIRDITPLKGLTHLEQVWLASNQIENVGPLSVLGEIKILDVSDNRLTSVDGLAGLRKLESLSVERNYLDISGGSPTRRLLESMKVVDLTVKPQKNPSQRPRPR